MRCDGCGQPFEPRRRDQRYCAARCRLTAYRQRQAAQQTRAQELRRLLAEARALLGGRGQTFYFSGDRDRELRRLLEAAERLLHNNS